MMMASSGLLFPDTSETVQSPNGNNGNRWFQLSPQVPAKGAGHLSPQVAADLSSPPTPIPVTGTGHLSPHVVTIRATRCFLIPLAV